MNKVFFIVSFCAVVLSACSPRSYFLVNSKGIYKYDEFKHTRELVLEFNVIGNKKAYEADSISFHLNSDSVKVD